LGLAVVGATGAAQATNLVQNGNFSTASGQPCSGGSSEFGAEMGGNQCVSNWTGIGYSFLFETPTGGANDQFGSPDLFLDASTTDDTLTGGGGNFVGIDPVFENPGQITQEITGLTMGASYVLSFDYAGSQQTTFSGITTEGWTGSIGISDFTSPTLTDPSQGFTGWFNYTFDFTASGASELLTFLATGGPTNTQPPFSLLDNVSINQVTRVPEPMTLSLFGAGLTGIAGAAAFRRRKKAKTA
jgi:hypothetical protein